MIGLSASWHPYVKPIEETALQYARIAKAQSSSQVAYPQGPVAMDDTLNLMLLCQQAAIV